MPKRKGEGHDSEDRGVDLLVGGDAVRVDDLLEDPCDLVEAEQTRGPHRVVLDHLECGYLNVAVALLEPLDLSEYLLVVLAGYPAEAQVQLVLLLELVERRV